MTSQGIAYMDLLEQSRHNVQTEINATRMTGETIRSNKAKEKENRRSNKARERETSKHNRATEKQARKELKETTRSHKVNESENARSHRAQEFENYRSHRAQEDENVRSHKANESITRGFNEGKLRLGDKELAELVRSHKANEANQSIQSRASLSQARAANRQASAASSQARSAAKNAQTNKYKSITERMDVKNKRKAQKENNWAKLMDMRLNYSHKLDRLKYDKANDFLNRQNKENVAAINGLFSLGGSFVKSGTLKSFAPENF